MLYIQNSINLKYNQCKLLMRYFTIFLHKICKIYCLCFLLTAPCISDQLHFKGFMATCASGCCIDQQSCRKIQRFDVSSYFHLSSPCPLSVVILKSCFSFYMPSFPLTSFPILSTPSLPSFSFL